MFRAGFQDRAQMRIQCPRSRLQATHDSPERPRPQTDGALAPWGAGLTCCRSSSDISSFFCSSSTLSCMPAFSFTNTRSFSSSSEFCCFRSSLVLLWPQAARKDTGTEQKGALWSSTRHAGHRATEQGRRKGPQGTRVPSGRAERPEWFGWCPNRYDPLPWLLHPSRSPAPSPQPSYLFLYNSSFRASRSLVKSLLCCEHRKARSDTSRGEVRRADY